MWIQYKHQSHQHDPGQAKMMAIMPFIFGVMFFLFPDGLVLVRGSQETTRRSCSRANQQSGGTSRACR